MTKYSESLGLHIRSDGPNGNGNYQNDQGLNINIKGKATDAIEYSAEGIKHFNNWEAGLSSLQTANKERFEFTQATRYMNYKFSADQVKIVDDVAIISYPEFTDVSKVVWQHENGGIYNPRGCVTYTYYDGSVNNCFPLINGSIFPLINQRVLDEAGISGDYNNLFVLIEYDGYYSDSGGNIYYDATLAGQKELFDYTYGNINSNEAGKFYFLNGVQDRFMVLNSKFGKPLGSAALNPATDPRLTGSSQVEKDLDIIYVKTNIINQIYNLFYPNYNFNNMSDFTTSMGFLGYSKISIIKYATARKCGKVDLYLRKTGQIISVVSPGVVESPYNDLRNGDMIKISGALDTTDINGIKYVQISDNNQILLYDDSTFLTRTDTNSFSARGIITWVLLGNIYNNDRQGWSYKKTLLSPSGPNGYSRSGTYGSESLVGLPIKYQYVNSAKEIAIMDLEYDFTNNTALDPYASDLPIRNRVSNLDSLWAADHHFVNDCRFGSSIDLKKDGSSYRIIVGEQGPDTIIDFEQVFHIPNVSPYGKVYDFNLSIDNTKTFTISLTNTINASTGTSGVIMTPPEMYQACTSTGRLFYDATAINEVTRVDTATSQFYNTVTPVYVCYPYTLDIGYINDQYWYGSMLYHLPNRFYAEGLSDNDFFSDYNLCYLAFGITGFDSCGISYYKYYPYVDNFGKSVALNLVNGKWILAVGSTTKTDLVNKSTASCGPVHIFDITSTPVSIQRIGYTNTVTTPSRTYLPQKDRAKRFGACIKMVDNSLAIGCSKPMDAQSSYSPASIFNNEISCILIYEYDNTLYGLDSKVLNVNNFTDYYIDQNANAPSQKEYILRNNESVDNFTKGGRIYPSDRFGDYFDYDGKVIITNAFDVKNDSGVIHTDNLTLPNSLCDYIHIYEKTNTWNFIAKISASIDSSQAKYDYSNIYPYNFTSLRSLGNKNYDNSTSNSVTWDIDLTKSYVLADDRIIIKDPLGYGIFSKNWTTDGYSCSIFKVAFYANSNRQTNVNGRTRYTNPLISIGSSFVASHNDTSSGILSGTSLPSNQIITIDDLELNIVNVPLVNRFYQQTRSIDINRLDYLSLYMCNNIQSSGNLNIHLSNNTPSVNNLNLFVNNLGASNDIPLHIENASASGELSLVITPSNFDTGNLNLFINNSIEYLSDQALLYLENTTTDDFMPLYLKSGDSVSTNSTLNIYGGVNEAFNTNNDANFYINGGLISYSDDKMPIFISGLDTGSNNDSMPLFINNIVDSGNRSENVSIYIQNTDLNEINHINSSKKINLHLNATYGWQDTMPLVLFRIGTDGQEVEDSTSLIINNQQTTGNLNLYINSVDKATSDVNLFLPCGTGNSNNKLDTFIRGYQQ